ncbi:hypothetical protein [Acetomicrobium sp.]|uniref:hypothetical protein n=1 Tax=Acetomicrobium sp. TaxID=1872099 RepID=UPI002FCBD9EF
MIDEGKGLPLKVFSTMPSCVPSAPGFEDAGAEITPKDIADALKWEEIIGLGEMMNFPGVLSGDEKVHEMLKLTMEAGKGRDRPLFYSRNGHRPSSLRSIRSGIMS